MDPVTYVYDPGSAAVECSSGRLSVAGIQSNDKGTFITRFIRGVWDQPDISAGIAERQDDHGDYVGEQTYRSRIIEWGLTAWAGDEADMWDAIADLKSRLNLYAVGEGEVAEIEFDGRPIVRSTVLLAEPPVVESVPRGEPPRPWRDIVVTFRAPDPRLYGTTEHTVVIGTGATVVGNAGDFPAPVLLRFNGAATDPTVVEAARGYEANLDITIGAGDYIDLDGLNRTAEDDGGVNKRSNVTRWDPLDVLPGGVSWVKTGAGVVQAIYRDTWI